MSYYILTPVSNLNTILSTESISPASLYKQRVKGITHFDPVENEPVYLTRLYTKRPNALVKNSEQNLMMISVPESTILGIIEDTNGSLWTSKTIYLSPTSVSLCFLDETTLNNAWIDTEFSQEVKFAEEYQKKSKALFKTSEASKNVRMTYGSPAPHISFEPSLDDSEEFEMIDRFKGAIFAYYIGQALSVGKNDQELYGNYYKALDQYIDSITQMTVSQRQKNIDYLCKILLYFACSKALEESFDDIKLQFMNKEGTEPTPEEVISKITLESLLLDDDWQKDQLSDREINSHREKLEKALQEVLGRKKVTSRLELVPIEGVPHLSIPKDNYLADCLINSLIQDDHLAKANGDLRYSFARECALLIKGFYSEQWEESDERKYINALLLYLNEGILFDANDQGKMSGKNFTVLKTLAQFCASNNNKDLEDYYRFLRDKCSVTDYRFPFALWGATFGFSSIPKTLCNRIIDTPNEKNARKIFKEILDIIYEKEKHGDISSICEEKRSEEQNACSFSQTSIAIGSDSLEVQQ